ncbi:hypothetical protein ABVT39_012592 [Epinephelus coioides]
MEVGEAAVSGLKKVYYFAANVAGGYKSVLTAVSVCVCVCVCVGVCVRSSGEQRGRLSFAFPELQTVVSLNSDSSVTVLFITRETPKSSEQQQRPHSAGTMESDQMESRPVSSSSKKTHVVSDDGFFVSPDDLRAEREAQLRKERPDSSSSEKKHVVSDEGFFMSPDDLRTSATSTDSGVSISSVDRIIHFSHRPDNSSSKEEHIVADDDDLIQYSDDLVLPKCTASTESGSVSIQSDGSQGCTEHFEETPSPSTKSMATGSIESFDSGVSFKSDQSKPEPTDFKDRVSPRPDDLIGPDIDPVGDHDDLMAERNRLSIESFDSGVSLKSDWSKLDCLISKTESLPEEEYVVSDDEDLVKSSDDQERSSKEAAVSFKSDGSKLYKIYFKKKLSSSVMNEESVCSNDSGVSFKSDQSKGFIIYFNESSPPSSEQQQRPHSAGTMGSDKMESRMSMRSLFDMLLHSYTYYSSPRWVDFSSSEKKHVVADDEGLVESPDDLEDGKEPGVSFNSDGSKFLNNFKKKHSFVMMTLGGTKSFDSDVSLKRDQSIDEQIDFKDGISPRMAEEIAQLRKERGPLFLLPPLPRWGFFDSDVSAVEDFNKLLNNLRAVRRTLYEPAKSGFHIPLRQQSPFMMAVRRALSEPAKSDFHIPLRQQSPLIMATGSLESIDSGVSFKSDRSKDESNDFKESLPEEEYVVSDDEDSVESSDDQRAMGRPESPDSGVSLKSDRSKAGLIDFKDSVSPRLADFSSLEEEDVSDDEGFFKPPDDLFTRSKKSSYADVSMRSDPTIPIRCHSHLMLESIESSDFGVPFGINRYRSLPRLVDFGSDVSAGEVLKKISDDLRAVRRAWLRMLRDRLRKSHSSGIISASVRRKDSQGCTADVKDTPPSPKEKSATGSLESSDFGVPFGINRYSSLLMGGDEPGAVV